MMVLIVSYAKFNGKNYLQDHEGRVYEEVDTTSDLLLYWYNQYKKTKVIYSEGRV